MKTLFVLLALFVSIVNVKAQSQNDQAVKGTTFGQKFVPSGAISVADLPAKVEAGNPVNVKVKGQVVDVCRQEGCWLTLQTREGKMMVKMKGHAFTVPQSISGKEVVVDGMAKMNVTSVEELRHHAEDAGKSASEIESIKEPKKEIVLTANGVLVI